MKKKPVQSVSEKRNIGVACCGFTSSLVGGGMILSTLGLVLKEQVGESLEIAGHFIGVVTLTGFMLGLRYFIAGVGSPFLGAMVDRIGRQRSAPFLFLLNAVTLVVAATLSKPIPDISKPITMWRIYISKRET